MHSCVELRPSLGLIWWESWVCVYNMPPYFNGTSEDRGVVTTVSKCISCLGQIFSIYLIIHFPECFLQCQSGPGFNIVYPQQSWSSSSSLSWHCSSYDVLFYTGYWFPYAMSKIGQRSSFHTQSQSNPAISSVHSLVFYLAHETMRICLNPFISKALICSSSTFFNMQLFFSYKARVNRG